MNGESADIGGRQLRWIPLSLMAISVLPALIAGNISFVWGVGSIALAASMFLLMIDNSLKKNLRVTMCVLQGTAILAAPFFGNCTPTVLWCADMFIYGAGLLVPICTSLSVYLLEKTGNSAFMSGYYPARNFLLDASRFLFSVFLLSLMLVISSLRGAGIIIQFLGAMPVLILAVILFVILFIRYSASHGPGAINLDKCAPTEFDVHIFEKTLRIMEEEKPFLRSDLTVEDLCREIGTNRAYVSHSVNICAGMSIPRLVNNFRIKYAMDLYESDMSLTVSELAAMSGFGTGVSFTSAFRLENKINPRDWCKEKRDKSHLESKEPPSTTPEEEPEP